MLSWTGAGAVQRPRSLQIRLQRTYPGRVRAGAPLPTRAMAEAEVLQNLDYFTAASTRGLPVTTVVFSGVGAASRPDLPLLCAAARQRGVERIILHAGVEDLEGLPSSLPVDHLVLPLAVGEAGATLSAGAEALRRVHAAGLTVSAHTVLSPSTLPLIEAIARIVISTHTHAITLSFPFPVDGSQSSDVLPAATALQALKQVVPMLQAAGVRVDIKGLPACYLGTFATLLRRTVNRWYVDADHQLAKALMFFPDVVAFYKEEDCRFCTADAQCDGFFATYLRRPNFPPLHPILSKE